MSKLSRSILILLVLVLSAHGAAAQWRQLPGFGGFYNEIFFVDNSNGWISLMQDTVLRTTDGGQTFRAVALPGATFSFNRDLCFLSTTTGFASGEDGVWKTTDGGQSYTNISPPGAAGRGSAGMWFTDANNGVYAFGTCMDSVVTFCRTTDAGSTWTITTATHTADVGVGGVTYSGGTWWVAGGAGKIWTSVDGGWTWALGNSGSVGWQEDIWIAPGGAVFTASMNGTSCSSTGGGKVMRSTNGGASWTASLFPNELMWGVSFISSTEGWSCGDLSKTYKTTDGGTTWIDLSCGIPPLKRIDDIFFTDATHGWAVGDGIYKLAESGLTVSPDTIDFGDVRVGTPSADSLVRVMAFVPSASNAALQIIGTHPRDFELRMGGTLPVSSCRLERVPVRFRPTTRGVRTALLELTVPGTSERRLVVLKGRGVEPEILASGPDRLDTIICSDRVSDSILVRNVGTWPLTVRGLVATSPPGVTLFATTPFPLIVPPEGFAWIHFTAVTTSIGSFQSILQIASDDSLPGHNPTVLTVRLYRRGVGVELRTDTLLTLPPTPVGATSTPGCIEYRNAGGGTQTITAIVPLAGDSGIVAQGPPAPINVAMGLGAPLCFTATPRDTGWSVRRFRIRTEPCGLDTFITVRVYGLSPIISSDTIFRGPTVDCEGGSDVRVALWNGGNDTLVVQAPTFVPDGGSTMLAIQPATWPQRVRPRDSLIVIIRLDGSGPRMGGRVVFGTNDRFPARAFWSVRVEAARRSGRVTPEVRRVDLGTICRGADAVGTLTLKSVGDAPGQLTGARLLDSLPGLTIARAPLGTMLQPGAEDSIMFAFSAPAARTDSARVELISGPCGERDTVLVVVSIRDVQLTAAPADFGMIRIGVVATTRTRLANQGSAPAIVEAIDVLPPGSPVTVTAPLVPFTLAPGAGIDVELSVTPLDTGALTAALRVRARQECPDTAEVPVAGRVVDPGTASLLLRTNAIDFGERYACEDSCAGIDVESIGQKPVSITSVTLPTGLALDPSTALPLVLLPGAVGRIGVCYRPAQGAVSGDVILFTDDPRNPQLTVTITGRPAPLPTLPSVFDFGVVATGIQRDTSVVVHNPADRPLTITGASLTPPWSLLTPPPIVVAARDSVTLRLRVDGVDRETAGRLRLVTDLPCGDTLGAELAVRHEERYRVSVQLGIARGRWGHDVLVPVRYVDSLGANVDTLHIVVTAAPTLLDARGVTTATAGLNIAQESYDPLSGALRLRATMDNGGPIRSADTLLRLRYRVLRGDRVESPLVVGAAVSRRGVSAESVDGRFVLEDYCDAYGRLLEVTGALMLAPVAPNPVAGAATIEFETPFAGRVQLAVLDDRGNVVAVPLDEAMPAGRRRLQVDLGSLPSGSYTVRLAVGLQTLMQRLVIVK